MKKAQKRALYESIMSDVAKVVKKALLEAENKVSIDSGELAKFVDAVKAVDEIGIIVNGSLFLSDSKNVGHSIFIKLNENSKVDGSSIKNIEITSLELCDTDVYGRDISMYASKDDLSEYKSVEFTVLNNGLVSCKAWDEDHSSYTPEIVFNNANCVITAGKNRDNVKAENFNIFKK